MKTLNLLTLLIIAALTVSAQKQFPEVFETANDTADWSMFENGTPNPDNFVVVANPDKETINESDSCLQFTVVDEAQPWAGAFSKSFGEIEITEDNYILTMMVNKNTATRCLLKLEKEDGSFVEVFVENTLVDEWELLEFDFYDQLDEVYTTIVFFPDFPETRESGSICFVDNIGWFEEAPAAIKSNNNASVAIYPNPATSIINIKSDYTINEIQIFDLAGKLLIEQTCNTRNTEVNIEALKGGMYLVKINDATGNSQTNKFQVK